MARFVFQQSMIFEAGNPVDPHGEVKTIKAKSEPKARRQLPAMTGRTWVLIEKKGLPPDG